MAEPKNDKTDGVVLFNRGKRSYRTSMGPLAPGASLTVPSKEAKVLLGYPDLTDAAKVIPGAGELIKALKTENADLKAKLAALTAGKTPPPPAAPGAPPKEK